MSEAGASVEAVVRKARESFNRDLLTPEYSQIVSDDAHLAQILGRCDVVSGKRYLDLGTGSGYVAFELARRNPDVFVTGIDVAERAILAGNQRSQEQGLGNLTFVSYRGTELPFGDGAFYGAVSRYAFHHCPLPKLSARELYRVLEPGGFLLVADPRTHAEDQLDFANTFAALRDDGHVCWYREPVLVELFQTAGFMLSDRFDSAVTFPRPRDERYEKLLARTPQRILELYRVVADATEIHMTLQIMNLKFKKPMNG